MKLRACIFVIGMAGLVSCGPPAVEDVVRHKARTVAVQEWVIGADLAARKKVIVDTLRSQGANDERIALILACALAETVHLSAAERDASKDSAGDAKNYSAFNMNGFALRKVGWQESGGTNLNDDSGLPEATRLFNKGINDFGDARWLCLHRGGETAFNDLCSYGAQEYVATVREIAAFLLQDRNRFLNGNRYGTFIQHV